MKIILLIIICLFVNIPINAQNKKVVKKSLPPAMQISAKIENSIQIDSTVSFVLFSQNKFFSFSKDGSFCLIDSTGNLIWEQKADGNILVQPVINKNTIVVATDNNEINTYDSETGSQIQSIGTEDSITTPLFAFNYTGSKELMIPKETKSKSALVFGMANGKISCLDLESLQEYWNNIDQKDTLFTKPILINNKLVFSRGDGSLNCIDANNGLLIWRWIGNELSNFSKTDLQTDEKDIFVVSSEGILHSISFLLGRLNWRMENAKTDAIFFYSPSQNNLFIIQKNEKLIIFSLKSETVIDDFKLRNNLESNQLHFFEFSKKVFIVYNGIIYEATEKFLLREILKLDSPKVKTLFKIKENTFAALANNGIITIFSLR